MIKRPRLRGYPPELRQALIRFQESAVRKDVDQIVALLKTVEEPELIKLLKAVAFEGATASNLEAITGIHNSEWNYKIRRALRSVAHFYEIPLSPDPFFDEMVAKNNKRYRVETTNIHAVNRS